MLNFTRYKRYFLNNQFQKILIEKESNRVVSQKEIKTVGILTTDEISNWVNVKEEVEKLLNLTNAKIYSFRSHKNIMKFPMSTFLKKILVGMEISINQISRVL